jgi:iron only hydrogenase large subunit-like protein
MKYKALIPHLVPLDAPMEITARFARADASAKAGVNPENVRIYFLSPCPSKRSATLNPLGHKKSEVDYVLAINDVYPLLLNMLEKSLSAAPGEIKQPSLYSLAESSGVQWASAGGEAATLNTEKYMAVDGIHNVISILEEIENEQLQDIEFVEPSCCFGGCIGGPLVVSNPFSARARMRGFVRATQIEKTENPDLFMKPEAMDPHVWDVPLSENNAMRLDENIETALGKYDQMEHILATLPGLDCGACGAPTCAALAEDIVQGNALETDCIIKLKEHIRRVAREINILDL